MWTTQTNRYLVHIPRCIKKKNWSAIFTVRISTVCIIPTNNQKCAYDMIYDPVAENPYKNTMISKYWLSNVSYIRTDKLMFIVMYQTRIILWYEYCFSLPTCSWNLRINELSFMNLCWVILYVQINIIWLEVGQSRSNMVRPICPQQYSSSHQSFLSLRPDGLYAAVTNF